MGWGETSCLFSLFERESNKVLIGSVSKCFMMMQWGWEELWSCIFRGGWSSLHSPSVKSLTFGHFNKTNGRLIPSSFIFEPQIQPVLIVSQTLSFMHKFNPWWMWWTFFVSEIGQRKKSTMNVWRSKALTLYSQVVDRILALQRGPHRGFRDTLRKWARDIWAYAINECVLYAQKIFGRNDRSPY